MAPRLPHPISMPSIPPARLVAPCTGPRSHTPCKFEFARHGIGNFTAYILHGLCLIGPLWAPAASLFWVATEYLLYHRTVNNKLDSSSYVAPLLQGRQICHVDWKDTVPLISANAEISQKQQRTGKHIPVIQSMSGNGERKEALYSSAHLC
jgi:hypothetical protein